MKLFRRLFSEPAFPISILVLLCLSSGCAKRTSVTESLGAGKDFAVPPPYSGKAISRNAFGGITAPQVIYLNVDGATIRPNYFYNNDAQANTSFIVNQTSTIPAFNTAFYGSDRAQVIQQLVAYVADDFKAYNVTVTTTRPSSGNYTMMMVGGSPNDIGQGSWGMIGVSPLDYGNQNPNDVGFVFAGTAESDFMTLQEIAYTIAHEAGHTFGLDHLSLRSDIMYPSLQYGILSWGAGPLYDNASVFQDDNAVLTRNLGLPSNSPQAPAPTPTPVTPIPSPAPPPTPAPTPSGPDAAEKTVTAWYVRYLTRGPDAPGLKFLSDQIRAGKDPKTVLANILGSTEYFQKAGGTNALFIPKLYLDVLGSTASASWLSNAKTYLTSHKGNGGRYQLSLSVLKKVK